MVNLLNKKVKHSGKFGVGTVIGQDNTSIIVEFPVKTCKFQYPAAFEQFLVVLDKDIADAVTVELRAIKEVKEADKEEEAAKVIFHCSDGFIRAISRAKGPCKESVRPDQNTDEWLNWENDGRAVECDYYVLKAPLKHGKYKEKILEYCKVKYAPFDKDGNGNMGYLYDLNPNLAVFFIQEIAKRNPEVLDYDFLKFLLVK